jgi:hypothetical protein
VEELKNSGVGKPGEKGDPGEGGGWYTPAVTQPDANTIQFGFSPSKADMPAVEPVSVELPDSGGNVENGEDGFSPIATVEQTETGAVISITDKDGTTTATITNGKDGAPGKSAYEYAKEGGYTGTEAEFAAKLAEEYPTPDWNAAEGASGHVLNRTHYENGTEIKTLLDTTVTVANNQFKSVGYVPLAEGNTYTVTWDGAEYECVAFISNALGFSAPALGNPYFSGGENNGMPFGFVSATQYGQYGGAAMTDGSHTIKITEEAKVYKKLDSHYLPDVFYPVIAHITWASLNNENRPNSTGSQIPYMFDLIAPALWEGRRVILDFTGTNLTNIGLYKAEVTSWHLSSRDSNGLLLKIFYFYDGQHYSFSLWGGTWTPPTE